jgi:hypothetical protein
MTGEPQTGGQPVPPRLFDQDTTPGDAHGSGGRRLASRGVGSAHGPTDTTVPTSPVNPSETPTGPPVQALSTQTAGPLPAGPSARSVPSPDPVSAVDPFRPSDQVAPPALPTPAIPVPVAVPLPVMGSVAPTRLLPAVGSGGAGMTEARAPIEGRSAGLSEPTPSPVLSPDTRRPLVRPIPGRGRSVSRPRKTEKRPSFRGSRRLGDPIGIWRRLLSFIELVIVVAVLGALLAAVIGAIVGAVVVALQKALNG